jgi:hypothetical protein
MYMVDRLEGIEDEVERKLDERGDIEYDLAFEFYESKISVLRETEDLLRFRMEDAPADLCTDVDLRIVDDEEEVVQDERIVVVEFKDADETSDTRPAVITERKLKFQIIEYEDPDEETLRTVGDRSILRPVATGFSLTRRRGWG